MRARVAYISSLGTTAILVAAALLMLALVGALVAFRGWPGSANGAGVQQVPLGSRPASVGAVFVQPVALRTSRVVRAGSLVSAAAPRPRLSTAGLVKQASPPVVSGLIMQRWPVVAMHQGSQQPVISAAPPPGQPVVAPGTPTPGAPGPVTAPTPPLGGISLPDSGSALPAPQSPSSDQVVAMVGQLIAVPPPPVVTDAAFAPR
jgi:hypothetical protein